MAVQPAIQPEVSTLPNRRLFNVDEYYRMGDAGIFHPEERTELIEGEIFTMAPIGIGHAACVSRIHRKVADLFAEKAFVRVQQPVQLFGESNLQPDIAFVKPKENDYEDAHPTAEEIYWIIEVSDTSLQYDRNMKLPVYAKAGIPEVWIVDMKSQVIEQYTIPSNDMYKKLRKYKKGEALATVSFPEIPIESKLILPESE